jgi:hypothetical protein
MKYWNKFSIFNKGCFTPTREFGGFLSSLIYYTRPTSLLFSRTHTGLHNFEITNGVLVGLNTSSERRGFSESGSIHQRNLMWYLIPNGREAVVFVVD